jgi:hypothetical protein
MNNITSGQPQGNGLFEIYFAFEPNSYGFRCTALSSQPEPDPNSGISMFKYIGIPANPPVAAAIDPNVFRDNGGKIWWTVSGSTMTVEMKIPFAVMPDFNGVVAGKNIDVQFNYLQNSTNRGTTNLIGELIPWYPSGAQGSPTSPGVGIAFPICGDVDHPYPMGDIDKDCKVNMTDFAELAANWMSCTQPACE